MTKAASLAALVAALGFANADAAQACWQRCAPPPVVYHYPLVEYDVPPPLPPHYIVEQGPVYDGLGVYAPPRVYKPRIPTFGARYVYGYGVAFSGGPVVVKYPYVKRARHHRASPPLRVYY